MSGERAAYLAEVAAMLWPPPATVTIGRGAAAGETYLVLPRAADPRLVLPAGRVPAAAAVRRYAASRSWKAATRSRLLGLALRAGAGPLLLRDRVVVTGAGDSPVARLRAALGADVQVSFHLGPPRANRKPVLQLLTPAGAPVGFAKVGGTELTRRLVEAEHAALRSLAGAALPAVEVPRVLHHEVVDGVAVLVQSALPVWEGARKVDPAVRTAAMRAVARHAGVRTEAVGASQWGGELAARLDKVTEPATRELLARTLAAESGRPLPLGAWHGDWTPWNMAVRAGRALVWDWERFALGVPVGFDAVHYALQEALWRRGADPAAATRAVLAGLPALLAPFELDPADAAAVGRLYLVEIAARYLLDGQAAAGARLGRLDRWLLPALGGVGRTSGGAGSAQATTGGGVVVADTTEVSDSSSAWPDAAWTPPASTDIRPTPPGMETT